MPAPAVPPEASRRAAELVASIRRLDAQLDATVWDLGRLLQQLMALKEDVFRAKDIKELVQKAKLPMSHMTAQKYLLVARIFPRDLALQQGIEKCYALTRLAVEKGKKRIEALAMLQNDEEIAPGVRAKTAQAQQVRAAIKRLKTARIAREEAARIPPAERAKREQAAEQASKILRALGVKGATATIEEARGGAPRVVVKFSLATALALPGIVPTAMVRYGRQLLRRDPTRAQPLARAGWRPQAPSQRAHARGS
jgi:hypothetical protein